MNLFTYFSYLQEFPFANETVWIFGGGWVGGVHCSGLWMREGLLIGFNSKAL